MTAKFLHSSVSEALAEVGGDYGFFLSFFVFWLSFGSGFSADLLLVIVVQEREIRSV